MASHSQKAYKKLEASFLPISLTQMVDNFCAAEVQSTMKFRAAQTAAERCAAFLDFYALEVRLDDVDCFQSKRFTSVNVDSTLNTGTNLALVSAGTAAAAANGDDDFKGGAVRGDVTRL